jgi:hypothetical protein
MKKMCERLLPTTLCALVLCAASALAAAPADTGAADPVHAVADANSAASVSDQEAAYAKTLEKRAASILSLLDQKDEAKRKNVHDAVISQYRFLRDWHKANDSKVKELEKKNTDEARAQLAQIRAPLKEQHRRFVSMLEANLASEDVEKVKNWIVRDKLPITYRVYCDMLPDLTAEQKARILEILKEGREEAMDGGSSEEKTLIFGRYKGKVNNYLSSQGINMKQAEKEWSQRRKAGQQASSDGRDAGGGRPVGRPVAPADQNSK